MATDRDVSVEGYTRMLIPDGVGLLKDLDTAHDKFYPSRSQWGQFIAFHDGDDWLLVHTQIADPSIMRWRVFDNAGTDTLRITFEEDADAVDPTQTTFIGKSESEWRDVINVYAQWSRAQSWAQLRSTWLPDINYFLMNTTNTASWMTANLTSLVSLYPRGSAAFTNNYRDDAFDVNYPDYGTKTGFDAAFTTAKEVGMAIFPYINGNLWDDTHADYAANIDEMLQDPADSPVASGFNTLDKVCPSQHVSWAARLKTEFDAIQDDEGFAMPAIYLDYMAATAPDICQEGSHGHAAGDPKQWISGVQSIFAKFAAWPIMAEFPAEVYINSVDYFYAGGGSASRTDNVDRVPLFAHVYGDRVRVVGWDAGSGDDAQELLDKTHEAQDIFRHYTSGPYGSLWPDINLGTDEYAMARHIIVDRKYSGAIFTQRKFAQAQPPSIEPVIGYSA